jgi:serine/threonine protein kinase
LAGVVSLISHNATGRKLVWKQVALIEENKAKIMQEVEIAKSVSSKYLVAILDTFVEEGSLYIVMDYYSEGTLQKVADEVKGSKKPIEEKVFFFECIHSFVSLSWNNDFVGTYQNPWVSWKWACCITRKENYPQRC